MVYDDKFLQILNGFVDMFSQSYTLSMQHDSISNNCSDAGLPLIHITNFSGKDVLGAIKSLKPESTARPDDVPAFIIRDCVSVLARPLSIPFNMCLKSEHIPTAWKLSKICPIYKNGDKRTT
ncbi:hypothetical protein JTB14_024635 [Gonioctena quinquepunctata]|nr:hypothetical protein JTB14_024635 [Gonioctena quinquepunctata]